MVRRRDSGCRGPQHAARRLPVLGGRAATSSKRLFAEVAAIDYGSFKDRAAEVPRLARLDDYLCVWRVLLGGALRTTPSRPVSARGYVPIRYATVEMC